MFDDPEPCKPSGWLEGDSFETFHRFVVDAHLPIGVQIEPGDLLGSVSHDGWATMAVGHLYTRPFGAGRIYDGDLTDSQRCYLEVVSNELRPAGRYGDPNPDASAGRIARLELALPWRGRGLGRRVLRTALQAVPANVTVYGLDVVPYAPREVGRTEGVAQSLVEDFWLSAGFVRYSESPSTFAASRSEIEMALRNTAPLT